MYTHAAKVMNVMTDLLKAIIFFAAALIFVLAAVWASNVIITLPEPLW